MTNKKADTRNRFPSENPFADQQVLESMGLAVITADLDGNIQYANKAAELLYGWSAEEIKEQNFDKFVMPDAKGSQERKIKNYFSRGKSWTGEFIVKRKDGGTFPAIVTDSPVFDASGKLSGISRITADASKPHPAQKSFEVREAKLSSIFRAAPVGIGIVIDRIIHDVNEFFCELTGYGREDLIGKNARMVYLSHDEYERAVAPGDYDPRQSQTETFETRFRRKDGKVLNVLISLTPLFIDDSKQGVTFTVTDITRRKKVEKDLEYSHQTYLGIINSVNESIYIQDKSGRFLDVNTTVEEFYGYPRDYFIGKTPEVLAAPDKNDMDGIQEHMEKAWNGQDQIFEFWGRRKNGEVFPKEVSLSTGWYFGEKALIAVARDITDRKKAEKALQESSYRLTTVMNSIDAIVYVLDMDNHEILFLNDYGKKVFGDVTGKKCWETFQVGMQDPCKFCNNEDLLNDDGTPKKPFVWEFQNTANKRWYHCRDQAIPWSDGRMVRLEIAIDITDRKMAQEAMSFELGFKDMVAEISSRFVNMKGEKMDDLVNDALRLSGEFFKVDRCFIFQFRSDEEYMDNTHEWCGEGIEPQKDNLKGLPVNLVPWWAKKIRNHEHIHIPDVAQLSGEAQAEKEILEAQDIKSVLVIPMVVDGKAIGFYGYDSVETYKDWPEEQISLLKVLTEIISSGFGKYLANESLQESEMQLRRAQEIGHIGSWALDLDNSMIRASNEAYRIYGLKEGGQYPVKKIQDLALAEYRPMLNKALEDLISKGKNYEVEYSIQLPFDGSIRDIYSVAEYDKRRNAVFGMIQDITQRKKADKALRESEEQFRTLVESAFDGIYLMEDRKFKYVNKRFCDIVGYGQNEIVNDRFNFHLLLTSNSRRLVEDRYQARLKGEELPTSYEMELLTKEGKVKDVELSTVTLDKKNQTKILGVMRDITYRKQHQKLEQEVAIAHQSAKFKQNFLANMSHEIRTPITGIVGMVDMLSQTPLTRSQKDYLNTIIISTENLREIINQILDYSKIEAGQVHLNPREFQSQMIFENAEKLFYSICNKDINFHKEIHPDFPSVLKADQQRISQIINNFISNAVKFTDKGWITLTAFPEEQIEKKKVKLRIEISDTGIGINPEKQKLLFKPFSQVEQGDARNYEGTGLGLTICKELAHILGGEVGFESEFGKGSCFWFSFLAEIVETKEKKVSHKKQKEKVRMPSLRILFVEDKVVNQKVISLMLQSMGHKVTLASNGREALEIFSPGIYELIVMDIQMPVMDGITATRKLRERHQNIPPVIGLSANAFEGDREKYMAMGLDEYLTKPVKSEDFIAMVNNLFKD